MTYSPASRKSNPFPSPNRRLTSPSRQRHSLSSNLSTGSQRPANLPQPVRPKTRIESLHKVLLGELATTPSPHAYSPNHFYASKRSPKGQSSPSGGAGVIGRSKRFSEQKFQTPSPLDYQRVDLDGGRDSKRRVSLFGRSKRFDDAPENGSPKSTPAVGQYNVHESWSKIAAKDSRTVFGNSKREVLTSKESSATPDPAKYSPLLHLVPLPGKRASLGGSLSSRGSGGRSPSPRRPGTTGSPTRNGRLGSPQQRRSVTAGSRRSSLGRPSSPLRALSPPRPNSPYHETRKYSLSHSLQSKHKAEPAFSFGYSPKLVFKPNDTPPPDRYNSHEARDRVMKRNNTGSMPKSKRKLHDEKLGTPSPHQYQTDRGASFTTRKPTAAVFGKHKRQVSNYSSLSRGPGAYERFDSPLNSRWKRAGAATFGSSIRDVHRKPKQSTPSALDYSPNYTAFSTKAPSAILYFTG